MIIPPPKPFPNYKWRWASYTPSEGLDYPPVYLVVLRVYANHDGEAPSSPSVIADLRRVRGETGTDVDLARTGDRNLKRNSGQYWTAFGLLEPGHGSLHVTTFGHSVASGKITPSEFAARVVNNFTLPNKRIESNTSEWSQAGLIIKPLQLILEIMVDLATVHGPKSAMLTPFELVKIIIPLAGAKAQIREYTDAITQYRQGELSLDEWPDCAPKANDKRMAKEFLLFLGNYGLCNYNPHQKGDATEFYLPLDGVVNTPLPIALPTLGDLLTISKQIQLPDILADIERNRVQVSILARPEQARFRKDVLEESGCRCVVTGIKLRDVLQAAHIKPVSNGGNDHVSNGFCMRTDIHALFDAGHLKIQPTGDIILSNAARSEAAYATLPTKITIPSYVRIAHVDWRWNYK
ncbi:MAG: HNH endonuclease [Ktedonobacteraceae bacterium]